jgi:hypothetical protein
MCRPERAILLHAARCLPHTRSAAIGRTYHSFTGSCPASTGARNRMAS